MTKKTKTRSELEKENLALRKELRKYKQIPCQAIVAQGPNGTFRCGTMHDPGTECPKGPHAEWEPSELGYGWQPWHHPRKTS